MLLRLRYTDTLWTIAKIAQVDITDKEANRLLDLVVFSVLYDELSYESEQVEKRINRVLNVLSLDEQMLEEVFIQLLIETAEHLPGYKSQQTKHCLPSSCVTKTSSSTYTLTIEDSILAQMTQRPVRKIK